MGEEVQGEFLRLLKNEEELYSSIFPLMLVRCGIGLDEVIFHRVDAAGVYLILSIANQFSLQKLFGDVAVCSMAIIDL